MISWKISKNLFLIRQVYSKYFLVRWSVRIARIYITLCILVYFFQEWLIFHPSTLPIQYNFQFSGKYEEVFLPVDDSIILHGLYFHSSDQKKVLKGVIYYLHGNAGSLDDWGHDAEFFTKKGYDVFMIDYRGYGKSGGNMENEKQAYMDVEIGYRHVLSIVPDSTPKIVIGYSLGTGMASYIGKKFKPSMLILQAPYYSLTDVATRLYPFLPSMLLKYPFNTFENISGLEIPIVILSASDDEVIPKESTIQLFPYLKESDIHVELQNQGHNGFSDNPQYEEVINRILDNIK